MLSSWCIKLQAEVTQKSEHLESWAFQLIKTCPHTNSTIAWWTQVIFQGNSACLAPGSQKRLWTRTSDILCCLGQPSVNHSAGSQELGISKALIALERNLHHSYQLLLCQPLDSRDGSENSWILVFRWPILITGLSDADQSFPPLVSQNQEQSSRESGPVFTKGILFFNFPLPCILWLSMWKTSNTWNNLKYVKLGIAIILIFSGYLLAQSKK